MVDTVWNWHGSYDYFPTFWGYGSRYDVEPDAQRPIQLDRATENSTQVGVPYTWGGFDANFSTAPTTSTSDWGVSAGTNGWTGWSGALTRFYPSANGPVVGNINATTYAGSAGIDCSGFVYSAAGYVGIAGQQSKNTSFLIAGQDTAYAGYDAGFPPEGLQPMNYLVRHEPGVVEHTFYYQFRRLDGTGIHTIESTISFDPQGAVRGSRTWSEVNTYTMKSWWLFHPGESKGYALNTKTPGSQLPDCFGVRGQNVWYVFTGGPTTVTLTGISGGDPDLYLMDANLSLVGESENAGSTNETVTAPSFGTYYVLVHIWSNTSGGCVNYTINW